MNESLLKSAVATMRFFHFLIIIGILLTSCKSRSTDDVIEGGWESHEQYLLNSDMSTSIHSAEFTVTNGAGYIEIPLVTYGIYRTEVLSDENCATISILPYPINCPDEVLDEEAIYDVKKCEDGSFLKRFIQTIRIVTNSPNPCTVKCRILAERDYDYYDYADIAVHFE